MSIRGLGPSLVLQLRSQYQERSGVELLRDGNCAEAGFTAWTQLAVTPSKETVGAPTGFTQWAKLVANAGVPRIAQNVMATGRTFRIQCLLAGDGVNPARATAGGVSVTSTVGTNWQAFEFTVVAGADTFVYFGGVNAAGYVGVAMMSVQEVVTKTADDSEYCDSVTYLCSNRGGATEGMSIQKLEWVDRHTGAVTTVADFSASPGAGAVVTLPTGWSYACATAARTTQTGASTLVTGIAANAAPWRDAYGGRGGLAVECGRTNQVQRSDDWDQAGGTWTAGTMTPTGGKTDPAGGANAVEFSSAGNQYSRYTSKTGASMSTWAKWISGASPQSFYGFDATRNTPVTNALVAWTRISAYRASALSQVYLEARGWGGLPSVPGAGVAQVYGAQLEEGAYPSSYIPTAAVAVTRAAATLTAPLDAANTHSGKIPRVTVVTHFAQNETALDATIIDDSRGHLYYEQSTARFVYEVRGKGVIKSLPCTFSREQVITLRADIDEATGLMTLVVSGCTTGNGTFQTYAAPRRAVLCGDGYTAATMPAQQFPRGGLFAGLQAQNQRFATFTTDTYLGISDVSMFMQLKLDSLGDHGLPRLVANWNAVGFSIRVSTSGPNQLLQVSSDTETTLLAATFTNYMRQHCTIGVVRPAGGANTQIFLNGVLAATGPSGTPVRGDRALFVGGLPAVGRSLGGPIYGFKLFPYLLTSAQFRALHEAALLEANR